MAHPFTIRTRWTLARALATLRSTTADDIGACAIGAALILAMVML